MNLNFYKCKKCDAVFELLAVTPNVLSCCGEEMTRLEPNTVDAAHEKHVPVVEKTEKGIKVQVGTEPHPMIPEHYIMWIEVVSDLGVQRKYLKPGERPEAEFLISGEVEVYAYCNLHGLWFSEFKG